jgi:hypothetical protein
MCGGVEARGRCRWEQEDGGPGGVFAFDVGGVEGGCGGVEGRQVEVEGDAAVEN